MTRSGLSVLSVSGVAVRWLAGVVLVRLRGIGRLAELRMALLALLRRVRLPGLRRVGRELLLLATGSRHRGVGLLPSVVVRLLRSTGLLVVVQDVPQVS